MKNLFELYSQGIRIPYTVIRSKRKTMSIQIKQDASVEVRAPFYATDGQIRTAAEQKVQWIIRNREKRKSFLETKNKIAYRHLGMIPYQGEHIQLSIGNLADPPFAESKARNTSAGISPSGAVLEGAVLWVYGDSTDKDTGTLVEQWYRERAAQEIKIQIQKYISAIGKPIGKVTIRNQKTRWGSCSGKGNLNFNWQLITLKPELLEYVVVHELCHRKEMNHSRAFWKEVESLLPDYRSRRKELGLCQIEG